MNAATAKATAHRRYSALFFTCLRALVTVLFFVLCSLHHLALVTIGVLPFAAATANMQFSTATSSKLSACARSFGSAAYFNDDDKSFMIDTGFRLRKKKA